MIKINIDYSFRRYGFLLAASAMALSFIGILLITSANPAYQSRQIAGLILGAGLMFVVSMIDYRLYIRSGWAVYGMAVLLLLCVTITGVVSGGAARWIEIGPLRFQPSEAAKILLIVFFAGQLSANTDRLGEWRYLLQMLVAIAVPVGLILEQPDLSTSLVVIWIFLCILYMAGLDYKIIIKLIAAAIPCSAVFIFLITRPNQQLLNDYQLRRIMAWLSPGEFLQDSYQQSNSIMAIGSGSLLGKGLGNESPISIKNGNFLPEPHTDFIMAIAGEELGFAGCITILLLLGLIVFECVRIGRHAQDQSGQLICVGMAALISGQAFVNLCVVTGLMPNTGLTLPFVSYGLTSLVSLFIGLGIVLNVGLQRE